MRYKKNFVILFLLIFCILGFATANGKEKFYLTPRIGYGILDFSYKQSGNDVAKVAKGISAGLEGEWILNNRVSFYADADFVYPFNFRIYTKNDGKMASAGYNRKGYVSGKNDVILFGWKFGIGVLYNVYDNGRLRFIAGGGAALSGMTDKHKRDDYDYENLFFGAGLEMKANLYWFFQNNKAVFASFEPQVVVYSKVKEKAGGEVVLDKGALTFRISSLVSIGCSFVF